MVQTEEALTLIRKQNHYLAQARKSIREVIKARETLEKFTESRKTS